MLYKGNIFMRAVILLFSLVLTACGDGGSGGNSGAGAGTGTGDEVRLELKIEPAHIRLGETSKITLLSGDANGSTSNVTNSASIFFLSENSICHAIRLMQGANDSGYFLAEGVDVGECTVIVQLNEKRIGGILKVAKPNLENIRTTIASKVVGAAETISFSVLADDDGVERNITRFSKFDTSDCKDLSIYPVGMTGDDLHAEMHTGSWQGECNLRISVGGYSVVERFDVTPKFSWVIWRSPIEFSTEADFFVGEEWMVKVRASAFNGGSPVDFTEGITVDDDAVAAVSVDGPYGDLFLYAKKAGSTKIRFRNGEYESEFTLNVKDGRVLKLKEESFQSDKPAGSDLLVSDDGMVGYLTYCTSQGELTLVRTDSSYAFPTERKLGPGCGYPTIYSKDSDRLVVVSAGGAAGGNAAYEVDSESLELISQINDSVEYEESPFMLAPIKKRNNPGQGRQSWKMNGGALGFLYSKGVDLVFRQLSLSTMTFSEIAVVASPELGDEGIYKSVIREYGRSFLSNGDVVVWYTKAKYEQNKKLYIRVISSDGVLGEETYVSTMGWYSSGVESVATAERISFVWVEQQVFGETGNGMLLNFDRQQNNVIDVQQFATIHWSFATAVNGFTPLGFLVAQNADGHAAVIWQNIPDDQHDERLMMKTFSPELGWSQNRVIFRDYGDGVLYLGLPILLDSGMTVVITGLSGGVPAIGLFDREGGAVSGWRYFSIYDHYFGTLAQFETAISWNKRGDLLLNWEGSYGRICNGNSGPASCFFSPNMYSFFSLDRIFDLPEIFMNDK